LGKVAFRSNYEPPVFRKVAFGTWKTAADPTVYGQMDIDLSQALAYAARYSEKHGVKITPTHLVAKATVHCMKIRPEINGMIRRGRIYLREHIALFFQVNVPGNGSDKVKKANLSGVTLHNMEEMSLADIARRLSRDASHVKERKDPAFNQTFNTIKKIPWRFIRHFLNLTSWLLYDLNLDLSKLGMPRDPFGSAMITNVGGMGIDMAWAPLCPYTKVPLLLTLGAIRDCPVAVDGQVVVRPIMSVGVTFDHRFMDGVHAAQMSGEFKKCFADPETYFGI
jgi:pyruvate/2-oxoglutarate dehydrogenase complex dihydrolipoamide acyltransferase (E2) component